MNYSELNYYEVSGSEPVYRPVTYIFCMENGFKPDIVIVPSWKMETRKLKAVGVW
jgi:hypothetical protein